MVYVQVCVCVRGKAQRVVMRWEGGAGGVEREREREKREQRAENREESVVKTTPRQLSSLLKWRVETCRLGVKAPRDARSRRGQNARGSHKSWVTTALADLSSIEPGNGG